MMQGSDLNEIGCTCVDRLNTGIKLASDNSIEMTLIARVLQGENDCFCKLILPCERSVYLTAYAVLQNTADAEEVSQDAALKAFRYLCTFRGESRFRTWITKIALNEARMRLRKERRHMWESIDDQQKDQSDHVAQQFVDLREIPSEVLERKETRAVLSKALAALPEIYREVIVLRDIQEFSTAETSNILGIGRGIVKTRLIRARFKLRDLLAVPCRRRTIWPPAFSKGNESRI